MTTYRLAGFSTTSFEEASLAFQTEAEAPIFNYIVNWREPNGQFNTSFDIEAFDILVDELSVKASNPYLDVYVAQYDWGAGKTTYVLTLNDTVGGGAWAFVLGGDPVDVAQAATLWPQVIAGTVSNPLPGTGFAIGDAAELADLPGISVTENDLIIGTDAADYIFSGIGNDTIKGRPGDDTLEGQDGDDLVDGGGGNDSLSGGLGDDLLLGNVGDDILDGGEGADVLEGGQGSDTYFIDAFDTVKESRSFDGIDRIVADFDYTLVGHYEELELTGTDDLRGIGNTLDNTLIGNSGDNLLDGGLGDDTLAGRGGDDTYYLRDAGDVITERQGLGNDTVYTWFGTQAPAHVENLILKSMDAENLSGNTLNNRLVGNMADNVLRGGAGRDTLEGQGGDDTLIGGSDRDLLVGGDGSDTYFLTRGSRYYYGLDTVRENDRHTGTDHVITDSGINLGAEHVENLSFTGSGNYRYLNMNNLDNVVKLAGTGNYSRVNTYDGDDLIRGGAMSDYIYAGDGDDTLLGGAGHDYLDGGAGIDVMSGGAGNDTYVIQDAGDQIIEAADGGIDTLRSYLDVAGLANSLENLQLYGVAIVGNGNAKNNQLSGNGKDNLLQGLAGDDTLDGGSGDDTLRGGEGADTYRGSYGNDTYFLDAGDTLSREYYYLGRSDTVISSMTVDFSGRNDAFIENITLTGSDDIDAIRAEPTRSWEAVYAGTLRGNDGDNLLDGVVRAKDTMLGGLGDDVYVVETRGDKVIEGFDAGDDLVRSRVDFALSAHVERLKLEGNGAINGFGNGLDNTIVGGAGANRIAGREGNDTITGGAGADTFIFDRDLGADNVDTIMDFSSAADTIVLRASVFTGLTPGTLAAGALRGGTSVAVDADDRILYDRDTGSLYFDADGAGGADAVLFAVLDNKTAISADDFVIV